MAIYDDPSTRKLRSEIKKGDDFLAADFINLVADMSHYVITIHGGSMPSTARINAARDNFHKRAVELGKRISDAELESAGKDAAIKQLQGKLQRDSLAQKDDEDCRDADELRETVGSHEATIKVLKKALWIAGEDYSGFEDEDIVEEWLSTAEEML